MAFTDPLGNLQYWYDGVSSPFLQKFRAYPDNQNYWYNGSSQGFLVIDSESSPRTFAVLIGF
jgi:hypothetical protein